ncbi:MAG: Clp protease N-terminal domain-containing protein, partial [Chloroflexota bacterium]
MRIDKFTQKGQEAIYEAQNLAQTYQHPAIEPEHLLHTLITQEGGVVPAVLNRIGADPAMLQASLTRELGGMSRASGGSVQVGMSRDLTNVLD